MVRLIASSDYRYGDKQLKAGDAFSAASELDADILRRAGKATDAPADPVAPGLEQASTPAAKQRKPRTYKRRDMFAERNESN